MFSKVMTRVAGGVIAGAVMVLGASQANAVTYGFTGYTNTVAGNTAIGEAQLFVDVTEATGGISFKFSNIGTSGSSITDVYFDDSVIPALFSGILSLTGSGTGVAFSSPASPGDLPGGGIFDATLGLTADSDPPAAPNGVNPGEWLNVILVLSGTSTFNNVITALNNATLLIGLHVQAIIGTGGSESFINGECIPGTVPGCSTGAPIPLPAAFPLFASGLGVLGLLGWRRRRKAAA